MAASERRKILNIGLIGCGEIGQVVHIPTLLFMQSYFRITYLCDVSEAALKHAAQKIPDNPKITRNPAELCASDAVDAVIVANSDEYHAAHTILALQHDKYVLVEKPIALTKRDALAIEEAERSSRGKVMVGYMRRFAAPFEDALREIGGLDKILYARVRGMMTECYLAEIPKLTNLDIIGPNAVFVNQSGTFPEKFNDFDPKDSADKNSRSQEMVKTALEECGGIPVTQESTIMWRVLCGLGSHDLSVMREALGMPDQVVGSSLGLPFWK